MGRVGGRRGRRPLCLNRADAGVAPPPASDEPAAPGGTWGRLCAPFQPVRGLLGAAVASVKGRPTRATPGAASSGRSRRSAFYAKMARRGGRTHEVLSILFRMYGGPI